MKKIILMAALLLSQVASHAQVPISTARAGALGSVVTVKGVVSNGAEFGTGLRYIQDGTAGVACYNTSLNSMNRGDSITVTGTLTDYNGLLEIANPSFATSLIMSGATVHTPLVTTAGAGFTNNNEGRLLRLNGVTFATTGNFAANTNYTITQGAVQEDIRINTASNLVGTPIPVGPVDVVGILGEYNVGTYTGTSFQLLVRDLSDIIFAGNPPIITTALTQSNITFSSFVVSFKTQNLGNTVIKYGLTPNNLNMTASNATQTTSHLQALTGLSPATIYYVQGLAISSTNDTSKSAITAMATVSNSSGSIKVYFNRSVDNSKAQYGHLATHLSSACDDTLIAYINRAQNTLDLAIYNMDNNLGIITALNAAVSRGVVVRVVADPSIGANFSLLSTSQKVLANNLQGIMHNKFVVIDRNDALRSIVWTGSMNMTDQQVLTDRQNIIIIQDQSLALGYTIEFEEMFIGGKYSNLKSDNTPHLYVIGGKQVEVYFSPTDGVNNQIKKHVATANYDLYSATYSYTRTDIAYTIIDSAITKNGAYYAGINGTSGGSDTVIRDIYTNQNVTTYVIDNQPGIFHHKYAIIDPSSACSDPMVITGSANWSTAGDVRNDENLIIIHDSTIANLYYQEFSQRYTDNGKTLQNKAYIACAGSGGIMNAANSANLFALQPNPANNKIQLVLNSINNKAINIAIVNALGQQMFTQSIAANSSNQVIDINTQNLTNGFYLVKMQIGSATQIQKLFVQH